MPCCPDVKYDENGIGRRVSTKYKDLTKIPSWVNPGAYVKFYPNDHSPDVWYYATICGPAVMCGGAASVPLTDIDDMVSKAGKIRSLKNVTVSSLEFVAHRAPLTAACLRHIETGE